MRSDPDAFDLTVPANQGRLMADAAREVSSAIRGVAIGLEGIRTELRGLWAPNHDNPMGLHGLAVALSGRGQGAPVGVQLSKCAAALSQIAARVGVGGLPEPVPTELEYAGRGRDVVIDSEPPPVPPPEAATNLRPLHRVLPGQPLPQCEFDNCERDAAGWRSEADGAPNGPQYLCAGHALQIETQEKVAALVSVPARPARIGNGADSETPEPSYIGDE